MQWFPGSVDTAIQISRKNKALLIVYIASDDENGKLMERLWNEIDAPNFACPTVGIRMHKNDKEAQQFAQVYPTPFLPASYLIDLHGKPLEVITHLIGLNNDSFRSRLNKAVDQFVKDNGANVTTPIVAAPQASAPAPAPTSSQQEIAEKVLRAKKLLEEKKKLDEEKKIEEGKMKEIERIKNLKMMQKAKEEREEREIREAAKQRAREKLESEKERERLRAQIKADREEAEYRKKREAAAANSSGESARIDETTTTTKAIPTDRCRIRVRMPNGSTLDEEFASGDNLNSLIEIIRQKTQIQGEFELSQAFPKRIFNGDDLDKNFIENGLTPSSSLIVRQSMAQNQLSKPSSFMSILSWLFLSPIQMMVALFTSWTSSGRSGSSKKDDEPEPAGGDAQPRRRGMPRSAEVRRRGNFAALDNPNDSDPEEEARYNGNSTSFL
ncbi:unnamed protein product [Caenorhabditis bovis]|uniref:UBX domain-containing protein 4 n=1 Tax=Caenorhabditis bovis TaxID=2654633 RepID=A0A8S1EQ82_9PELO|nr:unnamed protein product [Caenorhabditis bovis]